MLLVATSKASLNLQHACMPMLCCSRLCCRHIPDGTLRVLLNAHAKHACCEKTMVVYWWSCMPALVVGRSHCSSSAEQLVDFSSYSTADRYPSACSQHQHVVPGIALSGVLQLNERRVGGVGRCGHGAGEEIHSGGTNVLILINTPTEIEAGND